ncbi:hypothetical protein Q3227_15560 [Clostridioides difficile]|nr:hypothetical protein [Clostridioides difficile]
MCKLDSDGVIECCRAIDDFITALSNIKSLNMERLNTLTKLSNIKSLNMERLNTLTKYSSTCSILLKEGNYEGCTIVYRKMLEELKT